MKKALGRTAIVLGSGAAALVLMGGPALAHFCSNAQRSDTAQGKVAANSKGWFTFDVVIAEETGLCPEGVALVVDAFEAAGGDASIPVLAHAVLAQGVQVQIFEQGKELSLPKAIVDQDFAAFGVFEDQDLFAAAISACTPPA